MKTQKSADIVSGFFLFLLGVVVLIAASQIKGGMEERLPPRTLPYIVGTMILLCGAGLAMKGWRFHGTDSALKWPNQPEKVRIAVTLLAMAVFMAVMGPIGLPLSSAIYVAFTIWYLRRSRLLSALIIGALTGIISYLLFIRVLELPFPLGTLFID